MKTFLQIKDGLSYINNDDYIKFFSLSELIEIQKSINLTIKEYEKNNINNDIVKVLNRNSKNEYLEKTKSEIELIKIKNQKKKGLYLISESNKFLKIGASEDVNKRLKQIKTYNHNHLKCLYFIDGLGKIEKIIHEKFCKFNKDGEWFFYSDSIIDFFEKLNSNKDMFNGLHLKQDLIYTFKKIEKL